MVKSICDCKSDLSMHDVQRTQQSKLLGPVGIGGWLLFYCVCLTIVGPLFGVGTLVGLFSLYVEIKQKTILQIPPIVTWAFVGAGSFIMCNLLISFYSGVRLWQKKPGALRRVRGFLIYNLFTSISLFLVKCWALNETFRGLKFPLQVIISLFVEWISIPGSFCVWFSYFRLSRRVQNTFPEAF